MLNGTYHCSMIPAMNGSSNLMNGALFQNRTVGCMRKTKASEKTGTGFYLILKGDFSFWKRVFSCTEKIENVLLFHVTGFAGGKSLRCFK